MDKKVKSIKAHESQKEDGDWILELLENTPKEEWFLVISK
jgi:hypothetical protein